MRRSLNLLSVMLLILLPTAPAFASDDSSESRFSDMSLEQLMDISVSVTSTKEQKIREAPGIVTVITSEDIRASGARDLTDVLRLIPGLNFGGEVQNSVGMSFRGIWAMEGKILVRLDGIDWNELAYSNFVVGDRLPVSMIDRIEVIRGPGSVQFGGWAELAVIDIHTKGHENYNGARMSVSEGTTSSGVEGHNTYSGAVAKTLGPNSGVSVWAYGGRSLFSDRTYTGLDGSTSNLADSSGTSPKIVNLATNWNNLRFRFIYEDFRQSQNVNSGTTTPQAFVQDFKMMSGAVNYEFALAEHWKLLPSFDYTYQLPWNSAAPNSVNSNVYYDRSFTQSRLSLAFKRDSGSGSTQLLGATYASALGKVLTSAAGLFFPNDNPSDTMAFNSTSIFGEWVEQTEIGNFSVGLRSEFNPNYPSATVPRFAYTRSFGDWHVKGLASWAYRAPSFENVSSAPSTIHPERTRSFEIETGTKLSINQAVTVALFDTEIDDPIVYSTYPTANGPQDMYQNFGRTGARGIEADWRMKTGSVSHTISASYINVRGIDNIPKYNSGDEDRPLGIPSYKVNLISSWFFAKDWTLSPTIVYQSTRRAWTLEPDGSKTVDDVEPSAFVSLALRKDNLFVNRLNLLGGVANLLNQQMPYLVSYRSDGSTFASYPGKSRELYARLEYGIDF